MTSTYVENTKFTWKQFCKLWDDLHIRGEYWCPPTNTPVRLGWPPHTWRIPTPELSSTVKLGMTSTYVENTLSYLSRLMEREDDLHIRGEYKMLLNRALPMKGWPPHTWRILKNRVGNNPTLRMTSTYVENTSTLHEDNQAKKDDLHIRGEYSHHNIWYFFIVGWPPHTWRIQDGKVIYTDSDWMTSTYVENTINFGALMEDA